MHSSHASQQRPLACVAQLHSCSSCTRGHNDCSFCAGGHKALRALGTSSACAWASAGPRGPEAVPAAAAAAGVATASALAMEASTASVSAHSSCLLQEACDRRPVSPEMTAVSTARQMISRQHTALDHHGETAVPRDWADSRAQMRAAEAMMVSNCTET
eukprot:CAMPEP_0202402978 /NCGR_PEP_ID=MMETSP1128-20130828/4625_1 /ASSEMBLY_ACC=CAM_ASM_000463 /TAXON_ID=3047 /ORGANISM="Dunaliella tertiolecta, Strain CCMP1320" /LENGTH=158 /DNA_ID=CAMNT_0049007137 /DNA_START=166 /DNA_END=642 /DNA_ORIENTATION=-